ncbi:MAG: beta-propeller domain-containing protein [Candidatus Bathyarchaeia archaeon]
MQNEIKRRAQIYGIVAVLLAIVLGTICYNLGIAPTKTTQPSSNIFRTFSGEEEILDFLTANSKIQGPFVFLGPFDIQQFQVRSAIESSQLGYFTSQGVWETPATIELKYSTTNIQVAGVDEADIVKTDGKYIYTVSNNNIFILEACPVEEAKIISKLTFNDTSICGIFVSPDSERLAVLGCKYKFPEVYRTYIIDVKTFVEVYDVSNKSEPQLLKNFTMTGSYFNSRMIGNYLYLVVGQPAYVIYDTVILPKIYLKDEVKEVDASKIYYVDSADDYYQYVTIVAINMRDAAEEPTYTTIMMGGTSIMYASLNNIYITFQEWNGNAAIYRVRIENSSINPEAKGTLPGRVLNQFSMDEFNGYFRVATTTRLGDTTQNNVYILDMNLTIVGKLEDIAPGEAIHSARFIGSRCYLSTSVVRRDPFFVIDVENPLEPKVLGYLKIPGFTSYLHPYDENHLIGIGKDETNNVKISIFNVSNVSSPVEIDSYAFKYDWSDTQVLSDHKAFLFDRSKNLLAIPVSLYKDRVCLWQGQGLYVFNITLSEGLVLMGNITHFEEGVDYWNNAYWVQRSLYIENALYTISHVKIKINSLEDLRELAEIRLVAP